LGIIQQQNVGTHLSSLVLHYKVHDSLQAPYDMPMLPLPSLGAHSLEKYQNLVMLSIILAGHKAHANIMQKSNHNYTIYHECHQRIQT
jgi:hypothetical protein